MTAPRDPAEEGRTRVLEALRAVIDPEVGLNVVDLGLVYGLDVDDDRVGVQLTMTTPSCPLADSIARDAEDRIRALGGVRVVRIELVWDPPWSPSRMSALAKRALGWAG